jgi:hypothetical protein
VCLLDSGRSFIVISLDKSIKLFSMIAGDCGGDYPSTFCCNSATAVCNCRTVVTILVVLVVWGDSSSCSTQRILLRRFSILYAYFYNVDSLSRSVPLVGSTCGVFVRIYSTNSVCSA